MSLGDGSDSEFVLESGEQVLWSGRPHYPYFRSEAWAAFVFGIIASAAAAGAWFICCGVVHEIIANAKYGLLTALPIALIPAGMFSLVAFECLTAPWTYRRRLARARYVVTNRRVIVQNALGYARSGMLPEPTHQRYLFTPEQAKACAVKQRQGRRVDLVFTSERARRSTIEIGILGAEDWKGAEQALQRAFRPQPPVVPTE